jgi:hypothetical protein
MAASPSVAMLGWRRGFMLRPLTEPTSWEASHTILVVQPRLAIREPGVSASPDRIEEPSDTAFILNPPEAGQK